ncbi:MAG: MYXO-CTERM sorting domain-containing protein [Kofleriaceae bacterium]
MPRFDLIIIITAAVFAAGCGGGGCGGCTAIETIPGGFPAAKRNDNAGQVRVTQAGLNKIAADPAKLVQEVLGGPLEFNVPGSCSGTVKICCPNGTPLPACGPIKIDLTRVGNESARLVLSPIGGQSRLNVTVRARVKTETDLPANGPLGINCGVEFNTEKSGQPDLEIIAPINFQQDPTSRTTRINVGELTINRLEDNDIDLNGNFACTIAEWGIGFFLGTLKDTFATQIRGAIQGQTCKACPTGDVAECGTFATACTNNTCMQGDECVQELGLTGRIRGGALLGSVSPGTTGSIDLYEVAGGYATSENNGLAIGLLGGILPGGTPRDRCGPPATEPARAAIPLSSCFQGNAKPNPITGACDGSGGAFDLGIGINKWQLSQFAFSGYDSGFLCLTVGSGTVAELSTDTLSLLSRSLGRLVESNSPMAVGLRPQTPPTITLGRNRFVDDGAGGQKLEDPLLALRFTALERDCFAAIDDQYIRVLTVVTDVHLPIGLQVTDMGEIAPVIAAGDDAFTNITVKNSEALTESPQELAALFPTILNLVLPQLSGAFSPIALPEFGGLALNVTNITGVDNLQFMAIYADLAAATLAARVDTTAALGAVSQAPAAIAKDPKQWRGAKAPSVSLSLAGDQEGLEYIHRIDGGSWAPWSKNATPTITSPVFWLPGEHKIDVRARKIGRPETIDRTAATVTVSMGPDVIAHRLPVKPFHGQPGESGCNCSTSTPGDALPLGLLVLGLVLPVRRLRKRAAKLVRQFGATAAVFALVAILGSQPGCSCGSEPCGDEACAPGEVVPGGLGRFTSIAADETRVLVATYDQGLGDLVVVDVTDPAARTLVAVDGIPDTDAVYEPNTYRRGIEEPGPNVGAWTSIKISNGLGKVAYQDRDEGHLRYAYETSAGSWSSYALDQGSGEEVGMYASMVIDSKGRPAIAYVATGAIDGDGRAVTELRIARTMLQTPEGKSDWNSYVAASGVGSCAGLCGGGEACIDTVDGQTCTATGTDCATTCGAAEACVAAACVAAYAEPTIVTPVRGVGMYVSLVVLPDGRLAAAYYDSNARGLKIAVESGAGTNEYAAQDVHVAASGDRGLWASAVVDDFGVVHIAYQDAIGDQLLYTTWSEGTIGPIETVDDGTREGDRTHPVGAGASIYLVNGTVNIAYQDGMSSDVYVATKSAMWATAPLASGTMLDGFAIGVTTDHGGRPVMAWDQLDITKPVPTTLYVQKL